MYFKVLVLGHLLFIPDPETCYIYSLAVPLRSRCAFSRSGIDHHAYLQLFRGDGSLTSGQEQGDVTTEGALAYREQTQDLKEDTAIFSEVVSVMDD